MFAGERLSEQTSSTETHELRVAVFDLSQKALAGYYNQLSLIQDFQDLNDDGLPGITHESRAINLGKRKKLALPPMKVLGRLSHPDIHMDAYAVTTSRPIKFSEVALKKYELDGMEELVKDSLQNPGKHSIDELDAHLLHSAFRLPDIRKVLS